MAKPETKAAEPMPGIAPKVPRHRVLYMRREQGGKFQPVASFELGNPTDEQQGKYLFESVRAEHINRARHAAAPLPFFLEQIEQNGLKVED